jgi:8-oxo-dGTP diphosphatase
MNGLKCSVAGIALDGKRLFIARRLSGGDLGEKWEFPGGKVELDETESQALIREYQEEFNITIRVGPFIAETDFEHRGKKRTLRAYRIYMGDEKPNLLEHSEYRWAPLEEVESLDFAGSDRKLFGALKPYLETVS